MDSINGEDMPDDSPPVKPIRVSHSSPQNSFEAVELSPWLREQCKSLGISEPTEVQLRCIPKILGGSDVIGCSKTGTGKTLAFALPILQKLAEDPFGVFALILTPTRELAFQIAEQFRVFGRSIGLKDAVVVGGRDVVAQAGDLYRKPHVVIATPGRLTDLIQSSGGEFGVFRKIHFLVLDEADRLLDGQYADQLKCIFGVLPKKRQTLLFSATINDALTQLHEVSVKKPFFFEDKTDVVTVESLEQRYVLCPISVKDAYLVYVVKNFVAKRGESSVLIFCQTCRECQALTVMFKDLGFRVGSLHSMIPMQDRLSSLSKFRSNRIRILLCTDVAARGLDIPTVDLVVNHNVPQVPKSYVHRVGRAARAGRSGSAITFITQYDISLIQDVEKSIGKKLEELKVNDKGFSKNYVMKVSLYVTEVLVAKREAEIKLDEQNFGEKREINRRKQMILEGIDPEEADRIMEKSKGERERRSKGRVEKMKKRTAKLGQEEVERAGKKKKKRRRVPQDS